MMPDSSGKTSFRKEAIDAGDEVERFIRDAAETLRDTSRGVDAAAQTTERASEAMAQVASDAADASRRMVEQAAEEYSQMVTRRIEASKEIIQHTQQSLDIMMQVGTVLAGGSQSIMREWADYARSAMQCNIDGINSMMRAHTLQDLASAQSDLLTSEIHLLLNSSVRISEATARLAKDAAQGINDRTPQA
jgi:hypothetical protein